MSRTTKHRLTIQEDDGEHVMTAYVNKKGKDYEGADLSGLIFIDQKGLRGFCFKKTILYWSNLAGSDFSCCDFTDADLRGTVLTNCNLKYCDFRGANFGKDNVGGKTELDGANLEFAIYNRMTIFPEGFDPMLNKMIYKE